MTPDALVRWAFIAAWAVVVAVLVFVQLPRIVREGLRAYRRILALVDQNPLPLQLAQAEADLVRIQSALGRLPVLQRRADLAVERIRTTPIVPISVGAVIASWKREWSAFLVALSSPRR